MEKDPKKDPKKETAKDEDFIIEIDSKTGKNYYYEENDGSNGDQPDEVREVKVKFK